MPGPPAPAFSPPTPPAAGSTGLPAYTVPPTGGSRPGPPSFGVGGTAPGGSTFGPPSASTTRAGDPARQVTPTPEASSETAPINIPKIDNPRTEAVVDDPNATMAVPQQRHIGTLYGNGGYDVIDTTMPVSTNPVENSGSLTGHILAQGWRDEIVDRRRSNLKVAVAMLVVLGLLVTVSLVFLLTAGSAFTDMISGMFD